MNHRHSFAVRASNTNFFRFCHVITLSRKRHNHFYVHRLLYNRKIVEKKSQAKCFWKWIIVIRKTRLYLRNGFNKSRHMKGRKKIITFEDLKNWMRNRSGLESNKVFAQGNTAFFYIADWKSIFTWEKDYIYGTSCLSHFLSFAFFINSDYFCHMIFLDIPGLIVVMAIANLGDFSYFV